MKRTQLAVLILLLAGAMAGSVLIVRNLLGGPPRATVLGVPAGDQEVVWMHAATSGAIWERFVAGVRQVQLAQPRLGLLVEDQDAFPEPTAAVPEVALSLTGCKARLRIRWYKLTSDTSTAYWVKQLAERNPPPLAFIGGGSTDRALDLAEALRDHPPRHGTPPILLLTTATADKVAPDQDLMEVYPQRSFRFCFTNRQMAEAVVDFVTARAGSGLQNLTVAAASYSAGGDAWGALALLAAGRQTCFASVHTLAWEDDPYSLDLAQQFREQFQRRHAQLARPLRVPFTVGDFHRPNPPEAACAEELLTALAEGKGNQPVLVLPAGLRPARRFLRALAASAPLELRHALVVTGDSISFNNTYRDRETAWHIQEIPVPLVYFCHANPVATLSKDRPNVDSHGTDDLFLNATLVQSLLHAAFIVPIPLPVIVWDLEEPVLPVPSQLKVPRLRRDSDAVALRLRNSRIFQPNGNRWGGGEHVVYLRPHFALGRVLPSATLEVWTRKTGRGWSVVKSLQVEYRPGPSTPLSRELRRE